MSFIRLDKFLSLAGFGSRKEVIRLIRKKKVKVNSQTIRDSSFKINPEKDLITVENIPVKLKTTLFYYKMYKPKGYITSVRDIQPVIMELIPSNLPGYKKLFPVGRLDKDAEGLLLLTNDGILAHRLLHPKWKVPKIYEVEISKTLSTSDKTLIENGIELSDGKTLPCKIEFLNDEKTKLKITVYEGRHHLIKRMFGKIGYDTINIKRICIGNVFLEDLQEGEIKKLSEKEIKDLKALVKLI